jgi:hypothetical protein
MSEADTIKIESEDPVEARYEALGKVIQRNKEGLARLEKEEDAKSKRETQ